MIPRLVEARYAGAYKVWLRFQDGAEGEIDLKSELWGEIFEPLRDIDEFKKLTADPELHTLTWPNGAGFAPEWLHKMLSAKAKPRRRVKAGA
ncbi:MAG: DUF2442 domain-containing protein [Hyphomicrobiaceae bacterium]|nr:MAG: DUF2442 domain-containing protein [Hyphomicrobiaceae bacterium]